MGEMTFYQVLTWLIMVFQPVLEMGRKIMRKMSGKDLRFHRTFGIILDTECYCN
jgi:hypothetical protein